MHFKEFRPLVIEILAWILRIVVLPHVALQGMHTLTLKNKTNKQKKTGVKMTPLLTP